MADQLRFVSAASLTLDAFAEVFTSSFEGYFYPGTTTTEILATRIRLEQLDLVRSVVMLADDQPAGQAVLGIRGAQAWCGGFGVAVAYRGRGLAHQLGTALLEQARAAGATQFGLEVLTRNAPAIRTYERLGLHITRDLQIMEWQGSQAEPRADEAGLAPIGVRTALQHFDRLHPAGAAWQRDMPSLLVRPGVTGLALHRDSQLAAYVLFRPHAAAARIDDLAAERPEDATALLQALQRRYERLTSVNEPADSPITAAYSAAGFAEIDRQHEMALAL